MKRTEINFYQVVHPARVQNCRKTTSNLEAV